MLSLCVPFLQIEKITANAMKTSVELEDIIPTSTSLLLLHMHTLSTSALV